MKYQSKFWNKYFKYYDVLLKVIPYQELMETIIKSLHLKSNLKLLDLGAGTGNLNFFLPNKLDVFSLDNSVEALERLNGKFPQGKIIKHSILEKLPFDDNSFDRVVSNNVLYTLQRDEWEFVVSEIKRISKPNAIIVISNLNTDFKAVNIYKDHIRKNISRIGYAKTFIQLLKLIYPTYQMIRYNKVINKNNEVGNYSFLESNEQKRIFEQFDLFGIDKTKLVYSNQAYLNVFINKKNEMKENQEYDLMSITDQSK